jgi:hypothetical protein
MAGDQGTVPNNQIIVILNLFQDNKSRLCVILKQVQDEETAMEPF